MYSSENENIFQAQKSDTLQDTEETDVRESDSPQPKGEDSLQCVVLGPQWPETALAVKKKTGNLKHLTGAATTTRVVFTPNKCVLLQSILVVFLTKKLISLLSFCA